MPKAKERTVLVGLLETQYFPERFGVLFRLLYFDEPLADSDDSEVDCRISRKGFFESQRAKDYILFYLKAGEKTPVRVLNSQGVQVKMKMPSR